jgi:hypothetical protein
VKCNWNPVCEDSAVSFNERTDPSGKSYVEARCRGHDLNRRAREAYDKAGIKFRPLTEDEAIVLAVMLV